MKRFNQLTEKQMAKANGGALALAVGAVVALTAATAVPAGIAANSDGKR